MNINENLISVIDINSKLPYNAAKKEQIMTKKAKVGITKKREIVVDVKRLHFEEGVPMPEAVAKHGIKEYDYYNWKKRIEQLDSRKRKKVGNPSVFLRKMAISQKPTEIFENAPEQVAALQTSGPEIPTDASTQEAVQPASNQLRELVKELTKEELRAMVREQLIEMF